MKMRSREKGELHTELVQITWSKKWNEERMLESVHSHKSEEK